MANFGNKNETFAYLVGKDIAELKAKIEGIGTTSGGLDVLKVIVPAATEEQVNSGKIATVNLPDSFKDSLVIMDSYGSYNITTVRDDAQFLVDTNEKESFVIKLTDFKNPKETVRATIKESSGYHASDA